MSHEARAEQRPILPSLLPRTLRGLLAVALVLAAFMLANTAYLLINRLADALGWGFFASLAFAADGGLPKDQKRSPERTGPRCYTRLPFASLLDVAERP